MQHWQGLLGIVAFVAFGYLFSARRSAINWRVVISGVLLQACLAYVLLRFEPAVRVFDAFASGFNTVIRSADAGIEFLFGPNLSNPGGPWGFVFAFKVLPVIVFFAALMSVLYHLRVMQVVVAGVAWVMKRALGPGVTGSEAISAAANIFVGQTEAPLFVRPFLPGMTRSQLMAVMAGGFATIAGSVMAAYVGMLGGESDEGRILFAKHLMTAGVMSAPASFVMAKLLMPETQTPPAEDLPSLWRLPRSTRNVVDAAAAGAGDGLRLALNVAAMLVAFVALLALLNLPVGWIGSRLGADGVTIQGLLGVLMRPGAWLMGVPWVDTGPIGALTGVAVVATEFVAYVDLQKLIQTQAVDSRSAQIATYALCGFANIPSIGIQIGGLSALAPERRGDLASLAPRAMVAGLLACWMTAAIASVFIP